VQSFDADQQQRQQAAYQARLAGGAEMPAVLAAFGDQPDLAVATANLIVGNPFGLAQWRQPLAPLQQQPGTGFPAGGGLELGERPGGGSGEVHRRISRALSSAANSRSRSLPSLYRPSETRSAPLRPRRA